MCRQGGGGSNGGYTTVKNCVTLGRDRGREDTHSKRRGTCDDRELLGFTVVFNVDGMVESPTEKVTWARNKIVRDSRLGELCVRPIWMQDGRPCAWVRTFGFGC